MSGPCTDCGGPDYQTLEARIADLEAENKRAVYGCCEECRALSEAEAERDALEELVEELDPYHLNRNKMGMRRTREGGDG